MANYSYLNPESIRPSYKWQPEGALAGMLYARDRSRYEDMAGMQDFFTPLNLPGNPAKNQEEF